MAVAAPCLVAVPAAGAATFITVEWGDRCNQHVSSQPASTLRARHGQRGVALFRPWYLRGNVNVF